MKNKIILLALLITATHFAHAHESNKIKPPRKLFNQEQAAENTKAIFDITQNFTSRYIGRSLTNEFKQSTAEQIGRIKYGINYLSAPEIAAARSEKEEIENELNECSKDANNKIKSTSITYLENLSLAKLRGIGMDYLTQSQTVLSTVRNQKVFDPEYTKFESLKNRLELEISMIRRN